MPKLEFNQVLRVAMVILTCGVLALAAAILLQGRRLVTLTLAAGAPSGESYILSSALRTVVERHYPKIHLRLRETGGTAENLKLIERGEAQLATAQADLPPGPSARLVAILYDDVFQLLAQENRPIRRFVDLKQARIALARSGGQYQSFLRVAEHFGLYETDFQFIGDTDAAAEQAFARGQADALFRVRALGNPAIHQIALAGHVVFIPVQHASAMKIAQPAFEPAVIPQGAYSGNPPIPAEDLPTVAVHRTLLAHAQATDSAVQAVTETLMERRQEILEEIAPQLREVRLLLAHTHKPEEQSVFGAAVHPGALRYYNRDQPSFLQSHADYVGLLLSVGVMVGSWLWELKRWMQRQQKQNADAYSDRVMALMTEAQQTASLARIDEIWKDLLAILTEAVHDLDRDKLSEESFNSFRAILQISMDATKERRNLLTLRPELASAQTARAASLPV